MIRLQELNGEAFDIAFLSAMIEHHQGALEMSESYLPEGKRSEVAAAAKKIIADQKKEIAQMTGWAKEWSGEAPQPEMRRMMKDELAPMMAAFERDCRADCDRAYLSHMKAHHETAIDMAEMAQEKAARPELKALAARIIHSQSEEIQQFDRWLGGAEASEDSGHQKRSRRG